VRRPRTLALPAAALLLHLAGGCAAWRPLPRQDWERATAHADVFTTRLRVTRRDGKRLYVEQPKWTATHLRGVYPPGWPRTPAEDSVVVIPRDSIAGVARLESSGRRTAVYLLLVGAAAGVALAQ
jgi:hypothetical protein